MPRRGDLRRSCTGGLDGSRGLRLRSECPLSVSERLVHGISRRNRSRRCCGDVLRLHLLGIGRMYQPHHRVLHELYVRRRLFNCDPRQHLQPSHGNLQRRGAAVRRPCRGAVPTDRGRMSPFGSDPQPPSDHLVQHRARLRRGDDHSLWQRLYVLPVDQRALLDLCLPDWRRSLSGSSILQQAARLHERD